MCEYKRKRLLAIIACAIWLSARRCLALGCAQNRFPLSKRNEQHTNDNTRGKSYLEMSFRPVCTGLLHSTSTKTILMRGRVWLKRKWRDIFVTSDCQQVGFSNKTDYIANRNTSPEWYTELLPQVRGDSNIWNESLFYRLIWDLIW